ncbi:MAG: hypothetical protein AAFU61_13290, partial [Pseudomonadota bacterium]
SVQFDGFDETRIAFGVGKATLDVSDWTDDTQVAFGGDSDVTLRATLAGDGRSLELLGGAGAGALLVAPSAAAQLTLDRDGDLGVLSRAGGDSVRFDGFADVAFALSDEADDLTILDTPAGALDIDMGGGDDAVRILGGAADITLDLGLGRDSVVALGGAGDLTVLGDAADGGPDALIVDLSAQQANLTGSLLGGFDGDGNGGRIELRSGGAPALGVIDFKDVESVTLGLGDGNDALDVDARFVATGETVRAGDAFDDTDVTVLGGGGDDAFNAVSISAAPGAATAFVGQSGFDTLAVDIAGDPTLADFTGLTLDLERLVVDNQGFDGGVAWVQTDGEVIAANGVAVLSAAGAEATQILAGGGADTLQILSTVGSDVDVTQTGNSVSLRSGLDVAAFSREASYESGEGVVDFSGLVGGPAYVEDGLTFKVLGDGLARDASILQAAGQAIASDVSISRAAAPDADQVLVMQAADGSAFTLYDLDLYGAADATLTLISITGQVQTVQLADADAALSASLLSGVVIDADGAAIDNIRAGLIAGTAQPATEFAAPDVMTLGGSGSIVFDTTTGIVGSIGDVTANGQPLPTGQSIGAFFDQVIPPTGGAGAQIGVTRFIVEGDLVLTGDIDIRGIGDFALSIEATNDVRVLGSDVVFDVAGQGRTAGAGGGDGGLGGQPGGVVQNGASSVG